MALPAGLEPASPVRQTGIIPIDHGRLFTDDESMLPQICAPVNTILDYFDDAADSPKD